jgi:hypothetical protein
MEMKRKEKSSTVVFISPVSRLKVVRMHKFISTFTCYLN